jgi:hypothetical protein
VPEDSVHGWNLSWDLAEPEDDNVLNLTPLNPVSRAPFAA